MTDPPTASATQAPPGRKPRKPLSRNDRILAFVLGLVFVGMGVACLFIEKGNLDAERPVAGGVTTTGTIISFRTGQNCGRYSCTAYYVPSIRFTTAEGARQTFVGPEDDNQEWVGEKVQVSYDPARPSVAHDLSANAGSTVLAGVLTGVLLAFGLLILLLGHRRFAGPQPDGDKRWPGHPLVHSTKAVLIGSAVAAGAFTAAVLLL
jgi:hypothetical protein